MYFIGMVTKTNLTSLTWHFCIEVWGMLGSGLVKKISHLGGGKWTFLIVIILKIFS